MPISSVTYILLELDRQIMSYYSPINSCNRLIGSIKLNMEPTINSTTNPSRAKICTSYSDIRRLSIYEYAIFVLKSSYIVYIIFIYLYTWYWAYTQVVSLLCYSSGPNKQKEGTYFSIVSMSQYV